MEDTDFHRFLDEIRAKVPIADVVGQRVKLVRKGREYTGLCPFHNEKRLLLRLMRQKAFITALAAALTVML